MLRRYGGRQTVRVKETERETSGSMNAADTLAALNYRADYSGRTVPSAHTHEHTLHTTVNYIHTQLPIRERKHTLSHGRKDEKVSKNSALN